MQKFSNRLISLRKEHGLTQEELAKIIKKTRSSVSGYETEGKEPRPRNSLPYRQPFRRINRLSSRLFRPPLSHRGRFLQRYRKLQKAF